MNFIQFCSGSEISDTFNVMELDEKKTRNKEIDKETKIESMII